MLLVKKSILAVFIIELSDLANNRLATNTGFYLIWF